MLIVRECGDCRSVKALEGNIERWPQPCQNDSGGFATPNAFGVDQARFAFRVFSKPALIIERLESGITRLAEGSAEEIVEARYAVQAYSAGKRIFFWAGVAPHCNCTGRRRITPSTQRTISARPSISAAFSRTRKSGPSWATRNVEPFCMTCISTSAEWPL